MARLLEPGSHRLLREPDDTEAVSDPQLDGGRCIASRGRGERVATDECARPDCDMFEAQTYPQWMDTS